MAFQGAPQMALDSFQQYENIIYVIDHFKTKKFPYHGSEKLFLDEKTRPKDLEVKQIIISTNYTSEQEATDSRLNDDMARNFVPPPSSLSAESNPDLETYSFEDCFNKIDDSLARDEDILLFSYSHEENSKLIKIAAEPAVSRQNNGEVEEHKNSDKSYPKLSENNDPICDIINFCDPANQLFRILLIDKTHSFEPEASSPWVKKEFLDFLKGQNYDELLASIQPLKDKKLKITDHQTLFTIFNAHASLAFPIFSYNLLQYLDANGNSLSKGTLNFFAVSQERQKVIESFSMTLWAIFEVRVSGTLDSFIFRICVLENFPLFNPHLGVRKLLNLLLGLFKDLRRVFADLVLCKSPAWRKPLGLNKLEEIDSRGRLPEFAKQKLCELMEDLAVFMKENRWVFLLELSKEDLEKLDKGFREADNLLNICLREIVMMIEKNII